MHQNGYYIDKDGMLYWITRGRTGGYLVQDQRLDEPTFMQEPPTGLQFLSTMWDCRAVQGHIARVPACVADPA